MNIDEILVKQREFFESGKTNKVVEFEDII